MPDDDPRPHLGVLGPLQVHDGSTWRTVGSPKRRAVLAALVARAPHPVAVETLLREVWGEQPPASARTQVHGYVLHLRRALPSPVADALTTTTTGYGLDVATLGTDADHAERGLVVARAALAAGDAAGAAAVLDGVRGLWRGDPFEDVPATPVVRARVEHLVELRREVEETGFAALLAQGLHAEAVGPLTRHLAAHPLREHVCAQLMTALHRTGRQAEALQAYRRLRRVLVEELGVEPCAEVQALHGEILRSATRPVRAVSGRAAAAPPDAAAAPARPRPRLPATPEALVGRDVELGEVTRRLRPGAAAPVVVVHGGPGVGRTAFALHAAAASAGIYPDGQAYLPGTGPGHTSSPVEQLVEDLLTQLGVTALPGSAPARAALLRAHLHDRRVLVVLDDATDGDQVRALAPPGASSALLVTSRHLLLDAPSTARVGLQALLRVDAVELLRRTVGGGRVEIEPVAATAVVERCGRLPLAVRAVGGHLAARPGWSVQTALTRLEGDGRPVQGLRLGSLDLGASVGRSLVALSPGARDLFALLSLAGPVDLPSWAARALLDVAPGVAEGHLDELVDAHLLGTSCADGRPRYRLEDVLRADATQRCADLAPAVVDPALDRLLATWLELARRATDALPPNPFAPPRGDDLRAVTTPPDATAQITADALGWFDAERAGLLAAVRSAGHHGRRRTCWQLAVALVPYLDARAHLADWGESHEIASAVTDEPLGRAALLRSLAQLHLYHSRMPEAARCAEEALGLFESVGHERGVAMALGARAVCHRLTGRPDLALPLLRRAVRIVTPTAPAAAAHLRWGTARALADLGELDAAVTELERARRLAREVDDSHREAVVLRELGIVHGRQGNPARALTALAEAEQVFEALGDERCLAHVSQARGQILSERADVERGDLEHAAFALGRAASIFDRGSTRPDAAQCLRELARVELARGAVAAARALRARADELDEMSA